MKGPYQALRKISPETNRYPYCLVWTPLPLITYIFPFIGHTGICTSSGQIHDFSGPYSVTVDDMAFGNPTKYVELEIKNEFWDDHIREGDVEYRKRMHNLFCDNCHSHCAYVLNQSKYQGGGWNMVWVAWLVFTKSKYTGFGGFIKSYIGFFVFVSLFIVFYLKPFS